jgi:hypothetical protein
MDDITTASAPIQVVYPETDKKPIDPASFTPRWTGLPIQHGHGRPPGLVVDIGA